MAGYASIVEEAERRYRLPPGLLPSLIQHESSWNTKAVSPAGAVGLTQLMPDTARGLGVTNPYDPAQSILGGAQYLRQQIDRFKSVPLALAAYNAGPNAVAKYGGIPPFAETQAYVKRVLADARMPTVPSVVAATVPAAATQTPLPGAAPPSVSRAPSAPPPTPAVDLAGLLNPTNRLLGLPPLPPGLFGGPPTRPDSVPASPLPLTPAQQPVRPRARIQGAPPLRPSRAPISGVAPLDTHPKIIGTPYVGSHTLFGNWESDNAVDLAAPVGTPVYAVSAGTIGDRIGPLDSSDPHLQGQRLHLATPGNEFYYAHLSRIVVKPGQKVQKNQLLGYSGEANGVAHLHLAAKRGNPLTLVK